MTGRVTHTLEPVFDERSRVLILGTIPSPKSRELGFYYGNPQNRFWRALAAVLDEPFPESAAQRRALCLRRGVALWDVLQSCEIAGASDQSIRNPVPNNLDRILEAAPIRQIFTTGQSAYRLYTRCCQPQTGRGAEPLPSSSPANCRLPLDRLIEEYRAILPWLDGPTAPHSSV